MPMPDIHSCLQLSSENERITAKYKKLLKRNVKLEEELKKIKEQFKFDQFVREQANTRSIQIQTDHRPQRILRTQSAVPHQQPAAPPWKALDEENNKTTNKMLTMHTNLMKRYQKELKTNTEQVEQIATLTLEIVDQKRKLEEAHKKIEELRKEKEAIQLRANVAITRDRLTPSKRDLLADLANVTKERDKLLKERRKFKEELKMLDRGFFEEVEDLKYALQQSAKLNTAYEAALRRLCTQFGIPVPSVTGSGKKKHKQRKHQREFR